MLELGIQNSTDIKKRTRSKTPSYFKKIKINKNIDEMNTIEGIELYEPLYELYSQLFYTTLDDKLECLNYYIDIEEGQEVHTAEIKDTWELPLKERYQKHLDLLQRVMSHDETLIRCNGSVQGEDSGQLSLFG